MVPPSLTPQLCNLELTLPLGGTSCTLLGTLALDQSSGTEMTGPVRVPVRWQARPAEPALVSRDDAHGGPFPGLLADHVLPGADVWHLRLSMTQALRTPVLFFSWRFV